MATKKINKVGRGLDSVLGDFDITSVMRPADVTTSINEISLDQIDVNPFQPRKEFSEEALEELAQSIRQQGVITPITVRQMPDNRYQLIAGERRFRASKRAGLTEIPAYVRIATDGQMMEMALVENIQRENLNAMEIAFSYEALITECKLTHEQLSEKVGKDRSTITNYLRLLSLPAETQLALSNGTISMAHARALVNIEDSEKHVELLRQIIDRQLSVRQTEQLIKEAKTEQKPKLVARTAETLPEVHAVAKSQLKQYLQSEVEIKRSRRGKGTVTIHFNSDTDFDRLMKLLKK
ncbi:MAG: ParB/RepB/Spo0J family partition protein [Bacteroidales bacterium]|nr:ParB/RepB/Spo0J family partition protein [Bacteroidales bacterium]